VDFTVWPEIEQTSLLLYEATENQSYLNRAIEAMSFLEAYHYDPETGGFIPRLNPETLQEVAGYGRVNGYNGHVSNAYYALYRATNDTSYLEKGIQVLCHTIETAYDSQLGYFYPVMYPGGQLEAGRTYFRLHEQLCIARSLLAYSQLDYKLNCDLQDEFRSIALSIINLVFKHALREGYMFIHGFYPNGIPEDSNFYVTRQALVYDTILDMLDYGMNVSEVQWQALTHSLANLRAFMGNQSRLFLRSENLPVIATWVNADVVKTLLRLSDFFAQTNTRPGLPFSTPRLGPGGSLALSAL
jgi:hypothetical protein